jgi:hypothetical protein
MPDVWGVTWREFCGKKAKKSRNVSYATLEQGRKILAEHPEITNKREWDADRMKLGKEHGCHLPATSQMPKVWRMTWQQFKDNQ